MLNRSWPVDCVRSSSGYVSHQHWVIHPFPSPSISGAHWISEPESTNVTSLLVRSLVCSSAVESRHIHSMTIV
ncbi:hypothetical protein BDV33DRAFT_182919 [Aspergillus novoparasiticus]|uniref:Uncharacterized protein n=2 Tax=Aspergillus subgen. Circumdati TaxID=2720871 RepID=A0A5N6XT42_9EURO|nr:hypothetical protein BDV33DRAFT_182919 [Aspergillus novoparasiticus]KAE8335536.1 hypothetical protein BDV24DRAFT_143749 [Aspergillus arachidicola]